MSTMESGLCTRSILKTKRHLIAAFHVPLKKDKTAGIYKIFEDKTVIVVAFLKKFCKSISHSISIAIAQMKRVKYDPNS